MNPFDADAVPSGGRAGGSSFRSSSPRSSGSSTRMYSSPRSQFQSRTTVIAPIVPAPMFSPFGYGFGGFGFGFSPFSFMPINLNVLIIGGIAYAVYLALQNRVGGSDFSGSEDDFGMLGSGASVIKLQLCLDSNWDNGNIQETLSMLAEKNSRMQSRSDIANLLSEASIALLRRENSWTAAAFDGKKFGSKSDAEPFYQKTAIAERAKFEEETSAGYGTVKSTNAGRGVATKTVVSLVVALRGKSAAVINSVRSSKDVRDVLQSLAADALTDEGENVMAVEVLWTPSEQNTVLSDRDIIADYPELIRL